MQSKNPHPGVCREVDLETDLFPLFSSCGLASSAWALSETRRASSPSQLSSVKRRSWFSPRNVRWGSFLSSPIFNQFFFFLWFFLQAPDGQPNQVVATTTAPRTVFLKQVTPKGQQGQAQPVTLRGANGNSYEIKGIVHSNQTYQNSSGRKVIAVVNKNGSNNYQVRKNSSSHLTQIHLENWH